VDDLPHRKGVRYRHLGSLRGETRALSGSPRDFQQARKVEPGTLRARRAQEWLSEPAAGGTTTAPAGWPAQFEQTETRLADADLAAGSSAPRKQRSRPHGRTPLRLRSLRFGGAAALVAALIVVISVGMMPLVLANQSEPASAGKATPVGTAPPAWLVAGGTYILPTPSPTPGRSAAPIPGSAFGLYQVTAGDNLTRIARSFGLSVTTLYWSNANVIPNPDLVKIGQKLLIAPVDGVVMAAAEGDTLDAIAGEYGIDAEVIKDANSLTDSALANGQLLVLPGVPNKALPRPVAAPKPEDWLNKLTWPVPGHHVLTLKFGCTNFALEPRFGTCAHWHNGLDIGAGWGTPVVAAANGTVIYAGRRASGSDGAGGGIVVWISHGGTLYTTYNHLSGVTVKAGQRVEAGQQVGTIGATGAADGAHLHFEVWVDYPWTGGTMADARDPLLYTAWKP
jgi:murein DD-endopeptidase MepM/ murein hydrolase activator NlpD